MQSAVQQPGVNMVYSQPMTQITLPSLTGFGANNKKDFSTVFPRQLSKVLAVSQLGMGTAAVIIQIILHSIIIIPYNALYSGYYCGVFFVIAGIIGVYAADKPGNCSIIPFMVLSILSSVMVIPLLSFSVLGLTTSRCISWTYGYESGYGYLKCDRKIITNMANPFLGLLLIISIAEAIVAIASSAVCCKAVCCCAPSFRMNSANNTVLLQSGGNQFVASVGFTQQQSAQQPSYGHQPSGFPSGHEQQAQAVANVHSPTQQMENPPSYNEVSSYVPLIEKK